MTSGSLVDQKYRLEERLGEGAVGIVYRAVHVGLEKSFAIKLLKTAGPPASATLERFRREAMALGRLRHPHIVEVTDFGIDGSDGCRPYIVTELLEGMPLSDVCRDQGPLPLTQALSLLEQIASAVDSAHVAGVLHRDLKPSNVFVCSERPESPSVKVLDFGLAELLAGPEKSTSGTSPGGEESSPGLTTTGSLLGTPLYLAPELVRLGQASRSSDIYSFGVLAYEILGGKPPFQGTLEEVLASHLEAEPPPLPLPPEVWRPLRETLQKDPALRPGTAGEVVCRFLEGMPEPSAEQQGTGLTRSRVKIALSTILPIAFSGLVLATGMSPLAKRVMPAETPRTDSEAQEQTVANMSNIGTAMFSWLTDQVGAAAAGQSQVPEPATIDLADYRKISYIDLEKILVPRYIKKIPEMDGWGYSYEFCLNANSLAGEIMFIRSAGRDGVFVGSSYVVGYFDPESFDEDIVWSDGFFVRWPQEPHRRPKFRRRQKPELPSYSRCTAWCADDSSASVTCSGTCSAEDQTCGSSGNSGGFVTCNGATTSHCSYRCPKVRCEDYLHKICGEPGSSIECYWTNGQIGSCDCIHKWLCGYS
ncbi:MAG TPA: serine/threonine-protein kinase [Thermoanaerobaculia bacterium]|nr:serine/threonine-protein kinase [Thermoanaerobaculia bacterium]